MILVASLAEGILPLTKSMLFVLVLGVVSRYGREAYERLVRVYSDWSLPGHGEAYDSCGKWRFEGCLDVDNHHGKVFLGLDGVVNFVRGGLAFIRRFEMSCGCASCPVCYEKWAASAAHRIVARIKSWSGGGKPIHLVVSPCVDDILGLSFDKLRRKAYVIAKKSGFYGGSCIFHPWRERDNGSWFLDPHFHMIGFGWIDWKNFSGTGWIVKNKGVRKSVFATAMYQLSHAGIHPHYNTVTWFGSLCYNKMRTRAKYRLLDGEIGVIPEEVLDSDDDYHREKCPLCGKPLRPVKPKKGDGSRFFGKKEDEIFCKADFWVYDEPVLVFGRVTPIISPEDCLNWEDLIMKGDD